MNLESVDLDATSRRLTALDMRTRISWKARMDDFSRSLVRTRMLRAFNRGAARFPVFRSIDTSVRRRLDEVLDDMALHSGLLAQRLDKTHLLLDDQDVFVSIRGRRIPIGSSLSFDIWARTPARLEAVRTRLLALGGEHIQRRDMFTIDWHFVSGSGLGSVSFDEMAEPALLAEAYPSLAEPVDQYVQRFLAASETVLVVLGPPGTGKTRLVRSILTAMSRYKDDSAQVMYTADQKAVESDEIFIEFVTGSHDAFVIEDADHLLRARTAGNTDLHRFLAIADGVVRAQGRKIIFTTNLPNISDIDDALVRPGRAFGVLRTRLHTADEALRMLRRLDGERFDAKETEARLAAYPRGISLAEIYRMREQEPS